MATQHAESGEIVDLATWADDLSTDKSKAIAKIDNLELARLVISAGTEMQGDKYCHVPGPIVVHCIDGEIELKTKEKAIRIKGGQLAYLLGQTDHAISAIQDSVVLLTIVLRPG